VALENLDGTHVYYVDPDGRACTCQAGQHGAICAHRLAVAEWATRDALAERTVDQEQATFEDEIERALGPAPKVRPTYEELFPACPCGNVADSRDGYCDRCAADREWQARRDAV
jgi:hypothetical protein